MSEWIEWHGGDQPAPIGTKVKVKHRDGTEETFRANYPEYWAHFGIDTDVIAYQVVAPATAEREAETVEFYGWLCRGLILRDEKWFFIPANESDTAEGFSASEWKGNPAYELVAIYTRKSSPCRHEEAEPVALPDELPEPVFAAVAQAIGGAYDCLRVWSAWGVGTMGPDDFAPVAEDGERIAEIARAAIKAWVESRSASPCPRCAELNKAIHMSHILFETGDSGVPEQALDWNGEVVLGVCKHCGAVEVELENPCTHSKQLAALEAENARLVDLLARAEYAMRKANSGGIAHVTPFAIAELQDAIAAHKEGK